jgi:rubrerythrin
MITCDWSSDVCSSDLSMSSSPMSEDNSLKYHCMSCGTQHKDISCPNCGSKMKKVGY